jgi:hypothetical protein
MAVISQEQHEEAEAGNRVEEKGAGQAIAEEPQEKQKGTDAPSWKGKVSLEKKLMKLSGVFRYGVLRFFFFLGIFYLPLSLRFIHTHFCFLFPNRHLLQIFICKLWSPLLLLSSCLRRRSGDGDGILLARIHHHLIMLEPLCHQVVRKFFLRERTLV